MASGEQSTRQSPEAGMAEYYGPHPARPMREWHEDMGPMLWWKFPIDEAPFCGDPRGSDWPGYHTHFTPIPLPALPFPKPPRKRRPKSST